MKRFVLDASVALRWFIDNPVPSYAIQVRHALLHGGRAIVPALWHVEMANGLVVAERRRILTVDEIGRCLTDLELMVAQAVEIDGNDNTTAQVIRVRSVEQVGMYRGRPYRFSP